MSFPIPLQQAAWAHPLWAAADLETLRPAAEQPGGGYSGAQVIGTNRGQQKRQARPLHPPAGGEARTHQVQIARRQKQADAEPPPLQDPHPDYRCITGTFLPAPNHPGFG